MEDDDATSARGAATTKEGRPCARVACLLAVMSRQETAGRAAATSGRYEREIDGCQVDGANKKSHPYGSRGAG